MRASDGDGVVGDTVSSSSVSTDTRNAPDGLRVGTGVSGGVGADVIDDS